MNVDLTPDQRALVKRAIDTGRFSHEEEAMALWEERERRRLEILASLDEAEASLARGEGRPITEESMEALADEVKQRGRTRLAAERKYVSLMDFRLGPHADWTSEEALKALVAAPAHHRLLFENQHVRVLDTRN